MFCGADAYVVQSGCRSWPICTNFQQVRLLPPFCICCCASHVQNRLAGSSDSRDRTHGLFR